MRKLAGVLLVLMVTFLSACGGAGKGKQEKVLAVVNGRPITEAMLGEEAKSLPAYVRPILDTPEGRMQFLESLITRDLLMQEALRRGMDRREEVRERLNMARRSILLEALLRDVTEKAPGLSDEALKKFYDENLENFKVGERVKVSHVLFKEREPAEETARKAKNGMPFKEIMKTASEEGGVTADLGFIERGKFDKAFEEAAFAAPAGKVTGPVKTAYGYHLIQTGEKRPAGLQPFDEVKEQIAAELREQAQREAFETLLAQMKKQAKIQLLVSPEAEIPSPSAGPPRVPGGPAPQTVGTPSPGGGR
ncbi:MAG TPA: peptidyl-prolyl cis-trans isomerase [Candidatus Limnocylindrales bacterium]|nr:peptidyl-prolyl cis-trans isomerase [Candidatus Limnocylindrales bacterium]